MIRELKDSYEIVQPNQKTLSKIIAKKLYKSISIYLKGYIKERSLDTYQSLSLADYIYNILKTEHVTVEKAAKKFTSLINSLMSYSKNSRCRLFLKFIGMIGKYDENSIDQYIWLHEQLIINTTLGTEVPNNYDGMTQLVPFIRVLELMKKDMKNVLDKNMLDALQEAAHKINKPMPRNNVVNPDGVVDFDKFAEKMIDLFLIQQSAANQYLQDLFDLFPNQTPNSISFKDYLMIFQRVILKKIKLSVKHTQEIWASFFLTAKPNSDQSPTIDNNLKIPKNRFIQLCVSNQIFTEDQSLNFLRIKEVEVGRYYRRIIEKSQDNLTHMKARINSLEFTSDELKEKLSEYSIKISNYLSEQTLIVNNYKMLAFCVNWRLLEWLLKEQELLANIDVIVTSNLPYSDSH